MENYLTIACVCISATAFVFFGIIKACDWLIGLKYLSKDKYASEMEHFCKEMTKKFATIESHKYLKEDIDEIKSKLNDVHDVIMTFAVNSFKDKHE